MRVCIVQPRIGVASETFIHAHAEYLPADVTVIHNMPGSPIPGMDGRPILSQSLGPRALRKVSRALAGRAWDWDVTRGYLAAFRRLRPDVVLAEYGMTGVWVMEACRLARIPLIVHFHGYDASKHDVLKQYAASYKAMFQQASAIIAVSRAMERKLIALGAPASKVAYNPYGVNCHQFQGASPGSADATLFGVGRFVEKKAPYLTLMAFAKVQQRHPNIRLRLVGDGPLLAPCRDLAQAWGLSQAVDFLGAQSHRTVCEEMRQARAFVQHSIEASSGDSEGTPVAILEAGATGLPVIATRHAGIPDVVLEGKTGFLVDERDVAGMADHMERLIKQPKLAKRMGAAARERIEAEFSMERSIERLWSIIQHGVREQTENRLQRRRDRDLSRESREGISVQ